MIDFPRTMTPAERSAAVAKLVRDYESKGIRSQYEEYPSCSPSSASSPSPAIRIEVTAEDIRDGGRGEPCRCAVARAAERTLGYPVSVGLYKIERRGTWEAVGLLPDEVVAFVDRFDRGHPVEPMAFELIPIEEGA